MKEAIKKTVTVEVISCPTCGLPVIECVCIGGKWEKTGKGYEWVRDLFPRNPSDFTDAEKIQFFDNCNCMAQDIYKAHEAGHDDDDNDHWCFEQMMKSIFKKGEQKSFWDKYNSHIR